MNEVTGLYQLKLAVGRGHPKKDGRIVSIEENLSVGGTAFEELLVSCSEIGFGSELNLLISESDQNV